MSLFYVPVEETIVRRKILLVDARSKREALSKAKDSDCVRSLVVEDSEAKSMTIDEKDVRPVEGFEAFDRVRKVRDRDFIHVLSGEIAQDITSMSDSEVEAAGAFEQTRTQEAVPAIKSHHARESLACVRIDRLYMDPKRHIVTWDAKRVDLTVSEFRILYLLACDPMVVRDRDDILASIHARPDQLDIRNADSMVKRIRNALRKVDSNFDHIESVTRVGYRFRSSDANVLGGMVPASHLEGDRFEVHMNMVFDTQGYSVFLDRTQVDLNPTEFRVLIMIMRAKGRIVTRDFISTEIGAASPTSNRSADSHIKRIRKKLMVVRPGFNPIQTEYGVGYKRACEAKAQA